jgi:hypothetical protein
MLPDAVTSVRKATEALRAVYPEESDLVSESMSEIRGKSDS